MKHFTVMVEIEAGEFFDDESVNWKFCVEHATFSHQEACEFILHCGSDEDGDGVKDTVAAMTEFGCTPAFIEAYREAAREGAARVLFYV